MTISLRVYENGELKKHHTALKKNLVAVDEYLLANNISHETGKEFDDIVEYTKEKQSKMILIDNTNVLGVDGGANFISEYWIDYNEDIYNGLIDKLQK